MIIEINRYEQFFTVRYRGKCTVGDTCVELKTPGEMRDFIDALLLIAERQILEEIVITRELAQDHVDFITRDSRANDLIRTMKDEEEDIDAAAEAEREQYQDLENKAKERRCSL